MMRTSTLVVVAAVALLGLFAALDALRGTTTATSQPSPTGEEPVDVQTIELEPTIEDRAEVQRRLRTAGVSGTLFMTDEDCRLRALSLPAVRWVLDSNAQGDECEFTVAPDSRRVVRFGGGISWSPDGRTAAVCQREGVILYGRTGQEVARLRDYCAPAWKPDGTLTVARAGTLVTVMPCEQARECEQDVILTPRHLEPALRAENTALRTLVSPQILQTVWLSDDRVALIIRTQARDQPGSSWDLLAIFEGQELVGEPVGNSHFDELVASPSRRYLAVHGSAFRGLSFVDSDGRLLTRNPIASGHHAAWSPDERWTAVATGGSTYVFRTAETEFFSSDSRPRAIRIPVHAADVEWR
jgi:WD40-like Beta Propeller Repeat